MLKVNQEPKNQNDIRCVDLRKQENASTEVECDRRKIPRWTCTKELRRLFCDENGSRRNKKLRNPKRRWVEKNLRNKGSQDCNKC